MACSLSSGETDRFPYLLHPFLIFCSTVTLLCTKHTHARARPHSCSPLSAACLNVHQRPRHCCPGLILISFKNKAGSVPLHQRLQIPAWWPIVDTTASSAGVAHVNASPRTAGSMSPMTLTVCSSDHLLGRNGEEACFGFGVTGFAAS